MSTVNIKEHKVVEVEIEGRLYTEEEARDIYEALRSHFEKDSEKPSNNPTLKEILEKMEKEKNAEKVYPSRPWPFWPDPIKPEDISPYIDPFGPRYDYNHTGRQPDPYAVETTMRFKLKT